MDKAEEPAKVVVPEPFDKQRVRGLPEQQRPHDQPGQRGKSCPDQRHGVASIPIRRHEQRRETGQRKHAGHQQALAQKRDPDAGAKEHARPIRMSLVPGQPGQRRKRDGRTRHLRHIGGQFVHVFDRAQTTDHEHRGQPVKGRSVIQPPREPSDQGDGKQHPCEHGKLRTLEHRQHARTRARKEGAAPVHQWRLLDKRIRRHARHDQVMPTKEIEHHADRVRFIGFPRVATEHPGQQEGGHQGGTQPICCARAKQRRGINSGSLGRRHEAQDFAYPRDTTHRQRGVGQEGFRATRKYRGEDIG